MKDQIISPDLSGVAETLLLPVYIRAMESQRLDALIRDDRAVVLIRQINPDSSWVQRMMVDEEDRVGFVLRNREFDRYVRDFLARNPDAAVVHIGGGFDSRFERVGNGWVEWYDLDLPEVIELRRRLIDSEGSRYHLLACSAFEGAWLDTVSPLEPHLHFGARRSNDRLPQSGRLTFHGWPDPSLPAKPGLASTLRGHHRPGNPCGRVSAAYEVEYCSQQWESIRSFNRRKYA